MDPIIRTLPPPSSLSPSVVSFLNTKLNTREDLDQAPGLVSELRNQCHALDQSLSDLNTQLRDYLRNYASHSDRTGALLRDINSKLGDLQFASRSAASSSDGGSGKVLGEELPALAKEIARVDTVRTYAETALKLDTLVGDIEDAVSSTVKRTLRREQSTKSSEEMRGVAIRTLKLTEDTLRFVAKTYPQWTRLVLAVDHRVDRSLAILRPQAIADHRSLLTSLGWPPPLSTLNSSGTESKQSADVQNPLFTMKRDLKQQYCESFLALCSLQELQRQRKSRQLEGQNREIALHQPLWAIEELVNPISIASQHHFSKWVDKPEYIFALVYKVTRDYVDSMDELLQPLVDEAMLSGYSCREEWISAMVTSLSTYLAKEIFPVYVSQLDEESTSGTQSQARISWLHLIDLMIAFDKRIQSLASHSGIVLSWQEDGKPEKLSSFSVFCDRSDWLDLWADIELTDAFDKLKPEIENERSWSMEVRGVAALSAQEDNKSPAIAGAFHQRLSAVIDRCRSLPSITLRSRFLKLTGPPIIHKFLGSLLFRCQEAEGLTALTDDDALMKVAKSVNAARYFESILNEWCEDIFFLEMGLNQVTQLDTSTDGNDFCSEESSGNGILYGEIKKLEEFRVGWVEKLSVVVLRGFNVCCRDYLKNKKQWQEKGEEGWMVSQCFVGALDYLQGKMSVLENGKSSVLESIVGRDFLPRGSGIVTRRPLVLQLHKTDDGQQEYAEFGHLPRRRFTDFAVVRKEISDETDRITGKTKQISPVPIHLSIYSPNVVNLTLIDLPGLTKVAIDGQSETIVEDIENMVRTYVEKPNCIILAVSPANQDIATSDAIKLAREVDPTGERTFGVLTKLDLMDKGTNALDVLEGRAYRLQHPWVGIVNRSQADINKNVDMIYARRKEREYFATSSDYGHLASKMGSEYLAKLLSKHLEQFIKARIPNITSLINKSIDELESEMDHLGRPIAVDSGAQLYTILELCRAFDKIFKEHLDGGRPGGDRIYGVFDNQLPAALRKLPFDRYLSVQNVRKVVSEADGYQPHLIAPEQGYRRLIEGALNYFRGPAEASVDAVHFVLKELVRKSIGECQELKRFPSLQSTIAAASNEALEKFRDEGRKTVVRLVDMESSYLTVDFFRKLPQEMENQKGGKPEATAAVDRYGEYHFRRIGSNVSSYVNMVSDSLRNTIPKAVVYCQVKEAKQSLLNYFYTQIGKKEGKALAELLDEDPALMERRMQCAKRLELYKKARDEIDSVAWVR